MHDYTAAIHKSGSLWQFPLQVQAMKRLRRIAGKDGVKGDNSPEAGAYDKGIFFEACGPVFAIAQAFGAMPVIGVMEKHPEKLRFTWRCFRFWYSVVLIVSQLTFFVCIIVASRKTGFALSRITLIVVYGSVSYIMIFMIFIARQWPQAMVDWTNVEVSLPKRNRGLLEKHKMAIRIRKVFIVVFCMSIVEHLLGIIATISASTSCPLDPNDEIKSFFLEHLPVLFVAIQYSSWSAFLGKLANAVNTFMWFYVDLFIMLIAIGLSSTFKVYCDYLMQFRGKRTSHVFWDDQRNFYRQLVELVEEIDRIISPITIVSFSNNLYFICLQLMNTLNERQSAIHSLYFWYTLIYLIARTAAVCLYSAEINEESKRPLKVIRAVPLQSWCNEIRRFAEDVADTTSALSGMRFFFLTRNLLLSVAGTILTYELVILQFYEPGAGSGIRMCNNGTNMTVFNFKVGA